MEHACGIVRCAYENGVNFFDTATAYGTQPAVGIEDMEEVTQLNVLKGDFINLKYKLPSGQTIKLWDDNKMYYGAEICKKNSVRCYGLAADDQYLLVCEYGDGGSDAEIVIFKRL